MIDPLLKYLLLWVLLVCGAEKSKTLATAFVQAQIGFRTKDAYEFWMGSFSNKAVHLANSSLTCDV